MAEVISLLTEDEDDNTLDEDKERVAHTTVPTVIIDGTIFWRDQSDILE
jgi:hypothetical protein